MKKKKRGKISVKEKSSTSTSDSAPAEAVQNAWDAYFHAPYRGVRAYAFSKLFLVMVALDTWMLMIGHAGRYGVAGFNVAHFAWLDTFAPAPSPGLYVGVLLATGLLALTLALLETVAWAQALLFLLYTYSWSMSMLDSYQHHYFVSLVMLCMVFFPRPNSSELRREPGLRVSGFGYNLLGCTVAVLYTFTSIAKMDAQWCDGHTLRRISAAGKVFAPLAEVALALGISNETFWSLVSTSIIPLELLIAAGYALSIVQDRTRSRWLQRYVHAMFWLALSLHIGAEILKLDIGWFSYYMIALACTFLLPGRAIELAGQLLTRPASFLSGHLDELGAGSETRRTLDTWLMVGAVSGVLFATSYLIDLPGARTTALIASMGLFTLTVVCLFRDRLAAMRQIALSAGCAAALMWTAIALSDVRWDFYRYLAGDLRRRGELRPALDAYVKGERYAPAGSSRKDAIEALRKRLGQ